MWRDIKDTLGVGLLCAIGVGVVLLIIGGVLLVSRLTADFRGDTSVINKTRGSGNYRIASYDHFFDLCAAVQSTEGQIAAQEKEAANDAPPDRVTQIRQNVSALEASRFSLIVQYNADAAKSYTSGQFRSSQLPYHLDPTQETTTCTV